MSVCHVGDSKETWYAPLIEACDGVPHTLRRMPQQTVGKVPVYRPSKGLTPTPQTSEKFTMLPKRTSTPLTTGRRGCRRAMAVAALLLHAPLSSQGTGSTEFAIASRNLNLRVADPRLSENITDVDKELMIDAIRQLKIKRFVRQHEGQTWNHLPQYNFTQDKRTQLGVLVEDGDIISSSAIHTSDKILKDAYGRARRLGDFKQIDMEELMLQSVGALQELIEINKTLVTKFLQRTTISLQYLERRVNELSGSVSYLNTSVFEETKASRENLLRMAEVEERLVFARIEEQQNRSNEARDLEREKHKLAIVLQTTKESSQRQLQLSQHQLKINEIYETEKARRETELEIERIKNLTRVEAAKQSEVIAAEARIRQERENEDIRLRLLEAQGVMDQKRWTSAIHTASQVIGDGIYGFLGNAASVRTAVLAIVAIIAGVYFSREGAKLTMEKIREFLRHKPALVRETSYLSLAATMWRGLVTSFRTQTSLMDGIVLNQALDFRLRALAASLANTKKHGAPFRHILFHGPPGTGKTMVARRIAERSGLDYAIMSGGDVAPLKHEAVTEIHKLMKWSKQSSRGLMLFIDEAEAFVGTRSNRMSSEHLRNALNALLFHTGTQSKNFMMVLATNRPQDLDPAIIDRVDDAMGFTLPGLKERERLCTLYFREYVNKRLGMDGTEAADVEEEEEVEETGEEEAVGESVDASWGVRQLKAELGKHGLNVKGRKADLVKRLQGHYDSLLPGGRVTRRDKPSASPPKRARSQRRGARSSPPPQDILSSDIAWAHVATTNHDAPSSGAHSCQERVQEQLARCLGRQRDIATPGITTKTLDALAARLKDFSGREIAKFMISVQALAYAQEDATITPEVLELLVEAKLHEHQLKEKARENSDQY